MSVKKLPRRQAIPILYTRGTHYDVGFDMGRNFSGMIKDFLQLASSLNSTYLPLYSTDEGKKVYNETLDSVKQSFPQYIRELEGIADGANVEFHKLFLLHLDEILPQSLKNENEVTTEPVGCSTIILNKEKDRVIAHTEDALGEQLNHCYFVVAHIINDTPQGKHNVKEERFMSLCYAGHLPGYTMNYNHHGLVFTINTLSAQFLRSGHTPRHFITRALLGAENYEQALEVIKDKGVGAADGCSINMTFLSSGSDKCYNIEMGPAVGENHESCIDIKVIPFGEHNYHANQYEHMNTPQADEFLLASSRGRMDTLKKFTAPESKQDVLEMLSDCSGGEHCVFREDNDVNQFVKTISVGVFDLNAKTYTIYTDSPKLSEAHVTLPLMLKVAPKNCDCVTDKETNV